MSHLSHAFESLRSGITYCMQIRGIDVCLLVVLYYLCLIYNIYYLYIAPSDLWLYLTFSKLCVYVFQSQFQNLAALPRWSHKSYETILWLLAGALLNDLQERVRSILDLTQIWSQVFQWFAGHGLNVLDAQSMVGRGTSQKPGSNTNFNHEDDAPLMASPSAAPGTK